MQDIPPPINCFDVAQSPIQMAMHADNECTLADSSIKNTLLTGVIHHDTAPYCIAVAVCMHVRKCTCALVYLISVENIL